MTITSEKTFKKFVAKGLREIDVDVQLHEERHVVGRHGVPDLSYGYAGQNGWIEVKYGQSAKLRPIQRNWLERRGTKGGHCFILAYIGKEIFLVPHTQLMGLVLCTGASMASRSCGIFLPDLDFYELRAALTS